MKKLLLLLSTIISAIGLASCGSDYFLDNYEKLTDEDHVLYNSSVDEIIDILDGTTEGKYVIFFGFPSCPWCQALMPVINEAAKDNYLDYKEDGQDVIYYYDIKEIRDNNSEEYQEILTLLGLEIPGEGDDLVPGENRISVPYIVTVDNGTVIDQYMWDVPIESINDQQALDDLYADLYAIIEKVCSCD